MPAAKLIPLLDPIRNDADWIQDFELTIENQTDAENLLNVGVTIDLVKRGEGGDDFQVTDEDHVIVHAIAGRIAVRVPKSVVEDWPAGIYDLSVRLTWPSGVIDTALVAAVKVEQGLSS